MTNLFTHSSGLNSNIWLQNKIDDLIQTQSFSLKTKAMVNFFYNQGLEDATALYLIAWLTHYTENSYTCVDITKLWHENSHFREFFIDQNISLINLVENLQHNSAIFFAKVQNLLTMPDNSANLPIVLIEQNLQVDGKQKTNYKLYFNRLYRDEATIKNFVMQSSQATIKLSDAQLEIVKKLFEELFTPTANIKPDWQKLAVAQMLETKFGIITGGPGTGKTTAVIKLLVGLKVLALSENINLNIGLAAPTGKAAARLGESLESKINSAELPNLQDLLQKLNLTSSASSWQEFIPTTATTLHRMLGASAPGIFKKGATDQLEFDILIIDEASMLDVYNLSRCLTSLKPHARLFLLGDENQLASVEAGAILGDLCSLQTDKFTPSSAANLEDLTTEKIPNIFIDDSFNSYLSIARLRHSYRFDANSGIGKLANIVNSGGGTDNFFAAFAENDLSKTYVSQENLKNVLLNIYKNFWHKYITILQQAKPANTATTSEWDSWTIDLFKAFNEFQLLACVRKGEFGLEKVNQLISEDFAKQFSYGMPYLITKNDNILDIANGDIAILLPYKGNLQLHLYQNNQVKRIAYSRVEDLELAWCLSVHKSQGSEFSNCALLMPQEDSAILTKEILYTAITRSKKQFQLIYPNSQVVAKSLSKKVTRWSGFTI